MINRRLFLRAPAALAAAGLATTGLATTGIAGRTAPARAAQIDDDGLHVQPWFMDTFLEMRDDHAEAREAGKNFVVFFEQRGCPYCREMHEVNLARPDIADYVKSNFGAVRINIWGSKRVTDFDGEELEERALARKWGVSFTPTLSFFGMDEPEAGKTGRDLEVARMPGYFKPFHFLSMFEYVRDGAYADTDFQRYIHAKVEKLEEQGVKVDIWN